MTHKDDYKYLNKVVGELCNGAVYMRYVLTALASAVQERLGENIIFIPRGEREIEGKAEVLSLRFRWEEQIIWQHYIFYKVPDANNSKELLRVTLDIAHELGHLILERGPGRINWRVGISNDDLAVVKEIEAEWFALCILQIYGFARL